MFPASALQGTETLISIVSFSLHLLILNLGKKKSLPESPCILLISSEPHTVFHVLEKIPGHHLIKTVPNRVLLDAEPPTIQAGSLENWQIKDRSWEDKELALFYTRRGEPFFLQ